jgi:hypothetical protein
MLRIQKMFIFKKFKFWKTKKIQPQKMLKFEKRSTKHLDLENHFKK